MFALWKWVRKRGCCTAGGTAGAGNSLCLQEDGRRRGEGAAAASCLGHARAGCWWHREQHWGPAGLCRTVLVTVEDNGSRTTFRPSTQLRDSCKEPWATSGIEDVNKITDQTKSKPDAVERTEQGLVQNSAPSGVSGGRSALWLFQMYHREETYLCLRNSKCCTEQ